MALNLSILKSPSAVNSAQMQKTFTEQGGTIGRGQANDWVLADPDRFLSSKHCSISFEAGQYHLTDMSTNGTFVNGAPEPLGKGSKIAINNGDTIELGDYQLRIEIQGAVADPFATPPASQASAPVSDPFAASADPFGSQADPFAAKEDPFASPAQADPFAASSDPFVAPAAKADSFNQGFGSDPFADPDVPLNPEPVNADPLAALDGAHPSNIASPSQPVGFGDKFAADPFAEPAPSSASADPFAQSSTLSDGAGAINQSMNIPAAKSDNLIPDDWDDDDLMGGDPVQSAPAAQPISPATEEDFFGVCDDVQTPVQSKAFTEEQAFAAQETIPGDPDFLSDQPAAKNPSQMGAALGNPQGISPSMPLTDPPKQPQVPRPQATPQQGPPPEFADQFQGAQHLDDAGFKPQGPSNPQFQRTKSTPNQNARANVAQSVGDALLKGMGLQSDDLSDQDIAAVHASVGELMPVIVSGMMQILRSRASIKNEFRMNVTTIQPVENNPLKFSADIQEAMESMFTRRSSAYMGPVEAFQEGFEGIGEHQVAIIAGIRAAFKSMMDRFNPESLEAQFDKQGKGVSLPGMQKAKYWASYVEHYNGFIDNMENTFQNLFGDEFVQAYEDQLRRLAVERNKRQKNSL